MKVEACKILVVDPTENPELRQLADLTGLEVRTAKVWPFDVTSGEVVVSTIPVPSAASAHVLGVNVGAAALPRTGERWPDRRVALEEGSSEIAAYLSGAYRAHGKLIGFAGVRGGIGTSTLAASVSRQLARAPLAISLTEWPDPCGFSSMLRLKGDALRWADLQGGGPYLPQRLSERLPTWNRIRVLAADSRGRGDADIWAALLALLATSDVVVVDLGDGAAFESGECPRLDLFLPILKGNQPDVDVVKRWRDRAPDAEFIPILRKGGGLLADDVSQQLGATVISLGNERGLEGAQLRGETPGDRGRGTINRTARTCAARILDSL